MINLNEKKTEALNHIIYYEWYLDIRAGGPTGYLANLLDGLNQIDNNENPMIFFDIQEKTPVMPDPEIRGIRKYIHNFFYSEEHLKSFFINNISRHKKKVYEDYLAFLHNYNEMYCNQELFKNINLENTRTIHVHTVGDAVKVKNTLNHLHINHIKLMLTCHTPEASSREYYKSSLEDGYDEKHARQIGKLWKTVEKKAFEDADILVFPSKEAMEPLQETMDGFIDIAGKKDIRFIETGAKRLCSSLTREEAKKRYGVSGKFVIGYVGRHNEIKGYDILKEAAQKVLSQNENICFLIGGKQGNTYSPLQHERWIEAGWTNPADLFMAIDVFVLPNRMTYFDLVLLEVMSAGVPVIASATGGNKSVQNMTDALILYQNTAADLAEKIMEFSHLSDENRKSASQKIQNSYEQFYTTKIFAEKYKNLINNIYKDCKFI